MSTTSPPVVRPDPSFERPPVQQTNIHAEPARESSGVGAVIVGVVALLAILAVVFLFVLRGDAAQETALDVDLEVPEVRAPEVNIDVPEVQVPEIEVPEINVPDEVTIDINPGD